MDRRVADDAVVRPALAGLELRLHQGDDRARPGASVVAIGPRTLSSEMNDTSIDREVDRLGQGRGGQRPGVRPLHRLTRAIAAERLGELAATHVERVDAPRAALQQDVGEAAGRGPDVEAARPAGSIAERVERGRELVAAAADVRLRLLDRDRRPPASTRSPGLRSSRAASPSPTRTLPARMSAWAAAARFGQAALDEQLVEADPARAWRSAVRGTPAYRGTARSHRDSPAAGGTIGRMSARTPLWAAGDRMTLVLTGADTGESMLRDGAGRPAPRATAWAPCASPENPTSGTSRTATGRFYVGDTETAAGLGRVLFGPPGIPHAFSADSPELRVLVVTMPAGLERFFLATGEPARGDGPPPPDLARAGRRCRGHRGDVRASTCWAPNRAGIRSTTEAP